jgi:hypothetical protein
MQGPLKKTLRVIGPLGFGLLVMLVFFVAFTWVNNYLSCTRCDRMEKECAQGITSQPISIGFVGYAADVVDTVTVGLLERGKGLATESEVILSRSFRSEALDPLHKSLLLTYTSADNEISTAYDMEVRMRNGERHRLGDFKTRFGSGGLLFNSCACSCTIDSFKMDGRWLRNEGGNVLTFKLLNPDTAAWVRL